MKEFKDYEGVVCKDRAELLFLAKKAKEKGYNITTKIISRPRYNHLIFYKGYFCDASKWAIQFKISREEFLERVG
jgi:hypothetical protein